MRQLNIDIETYSENDIRLGVYTYVDCPKFRIMLFAYSIDDGPVYVVDLMNGETLPAKVMGALTDPNVTKHAYNANFEITCIEKHFKIKLILNQWHCTQVHAAMLGLPLHLGETAKALKLETEKDTKGKALIRFFTMPCKPTKRNGMRTRNYPRHDPEKWKEFIEYARQDVVVEKEILKKVKFYEITPTERELWILDQEINARGVLIDKKLVENAIHMDNIYRNRLTREAMELTGLDNPNSGPQLKKWLTKEMNEDVTELTVASMPALLKNADSDIVKRVLTIKQELAKTSVKKYMAMDRSLGKDGRIRGLFQYYGANRTGRWGGRRVQPQNLPRGLYSGADLDLARTLVHDGNLEMLEALFGNVPLALSGLIRTAFIAPAGKKLGIVDSAAIEARITAWLAQEKWRLDVFATHGKIYEASAANMFKVPIESITKGSELRTRGKISELALGFGGGPNALERMAKLTGAKVDVDELPKLVKMWRNANKKIVELWRLAENAAISVVSGDDSSVTVFGVTFYMKQNVLFIKLPSGRSLSYLNPRLDVTGQYNKMTLSYEGLDQDTKKWWRIKTYGGKLIENIVQAIARDTLAYAMLQVKKAGYELVLHVHDELVAEIPDNRFDHEKMIVNIMKQPIPWAPGLPLDAEGFSSKYYKK